MGLHLFDHPRKIDFLPARRCLDTGSCAGPVLVPLSSGFLRRMPRNSLEPFPAMGGSSYNAAQVAQGDEMPYERKWTRRKFIRSSAATAVALPLAAKSLRLHAAAPPSCTFNPEQEEGPYYVDRELLRRDITEGKIGLPLRVRVTVVNAKTCTPIPNAALDIWHCDAGGAYSGYTKINPRGPGGPGGGPGFPGGRPPGPRPNGASGDDMPPGPPANGGPGGPGGPGFGGPGGMPPKPHTTDDLVFLRGVQITDAHGVVEFKTIYPGHYPGRVNHIHMKVHVGGGATKPSSADSAHAGVEVYAGGHVAHT